MSASVSVRPSAASREPRETCLTCMRPATSCYCRHVRPVATRTRVIILQHPRERDVAIGTARMASLCLPESELHVGVEWESSDALRRALSDAERPAALLYPGPGAVDVREQPPPGPITLVVVDGTWWQAKALVRDNPVLAALPRYTFTPDVPSQYRIRKEPQADYVSTIEALVYVLGALEGEPGRFQALLEPFRAMIDRQLACEEAHQHLGPRHVRKPRTPLPPHVPPILRERPHDVVCVHGEANAWPYAAPERARYRDELVHWVAHRPSTGETLDVVVAPRHPVAPGTPAYTWLSKDVLSQGRSVDELRAAWRAFVRDADIACSWGHYATSLFVEAGLELPRERLDLRQAARVYAKGKVGTLDEFAARLGRTPVPPSSPGRAHARLAQMVAISLALCAACAALVVLPRAAWAWQVGVAPATTKVLPATPMPSSLQATIEAAQGEWEGFQIVVRDPAGAGAVDLAITDLCAGSTCIPSSRIRLYREVFVDVTTPSPGSIVDHPRASGLYPDPLVPLRDPYASTDVPAGAPFDLGTSDTGVFFVDVDVPSSAAPGTYTGLATVTATGRPPTGIPVSLVVWDFAMPSPRTVATAFGWGPQATWAFHGGPQDGETPERDVIADRYAQALHEHHLDPQTIGPNVSFSFDASGNLEPVDFTAFDEAVAPWIDGSKFGDGVGVVRFDTGQFGPGSGTGTMTDAQYAAAGKAYAEHLQAKGWWSKAYDYAIDEPWHDDAAANYAAIDHDADLLLGASDLWKDKVLVTGPFVPQIAGRIGIWCPVDAMYEDWNALWGSMPGRSVYAQRMAMGEQLWFYVDNADLPPYAGYDIDTTIGYEPRIVKWGAFYEGATGFLYWDTEHWTNDDPWNQLLDPSFGPLFSRNGDGFLLYPGNHDGTAMGKGSPSWLRIDGPVVSYRMKQIRDGLEDWEMFRLATSLGGGAWVREQIARAYTRFGAFFVSNCNDVGDYCPSQQPWTLDASVVADARHQVAAEILHLLHPDQYADPALPGPLYVVSGSRCFADGSTSPGGAWSLVPALGVLAALVRRRVRRQ